MSIETTNTSFASLARIGSYNSKNVVVLTPTSTTDIGVSVEQDGAKKAMSMQVIVPISRSRKTGSRRTAQLTLNGAQARSLYETLSRHFEERNVG
jgi:hypothetical protein